MAALDPATLDLGYLGQFVGQRITEIVLEKLAEEGYGDLRVSHGYVVQHLIGGPRTITQLARLLGVTQQAASKTTAELLELGYIDSTPASDDRRARTIALSQRGHDALAMTRKLRAKIAAKIDAKHGKAALQARRLLAKVLADLGGTPAVRGRRIKEPR
jgi:DNA-binding MarR family transcriptional regulator